MQLFSVVTRWVEGYQRREAAAAKPVAAGAGGGTGAPDVAAELAPELASERSGEMAAEMPPETAMADMSSAGGRRTLS